MYAEHKYRFFIQQYKNKIYSYSLFMLKNKMDADDVTQETMIRIWKNIESVNTFAAKTWIMRTTHNLCIDFLRKRAIGFDKENEITELITESIATEESLHNPYLTTHNNILVSKIKDAIQRLPQNMRSVFVLYEINKMKYKEIAKTLEMPENSVKVYLMRARKKLQEELKAYEE